VENFHDIGWNRCSNILLIGIFSHEHEKLFPFMILRFDLSSYCAIIICIMENRPRFRPNPKLKLMDQVREVLRYHHYTYRTEQTYCQWILRYIRFFGGKTHPANLGYRDVERFLSHLALKGKVSASTQRQALNALVFL